MVVHEALDNLHYILQISMMNSAVHCVQHCVVVHLQAEYYLPLSGTYFCSEPLQQHQEPHLLVLSTGDATNELPLWCKHALIIKLKHFHLCDP